MSINYSFPFQHYLFPATRCAAMCNAFKAKDHSIGALYYIPASTKKQAPFALLSIHPSIGHRPQPISHPSAWARCAAATNRRRRPGSTSWGCWSPPSSPWSSSSSARRPGGAASPSTRAAECSRLLALPLPGRIAGASESNQQAEVAVPPRRAGSGSWGA